MPIGNFEEIVPQWHRLENDPLKCLLFGRPSRAVVTRHQRTFHFGLKQALHPCRFASY